MLNRTVCKAKSGGIALLVKEYLLAFVKPLESSNERVFWLEIDEQLAEKTLLFGIVYIPPEVALIGDVNARCGNLLDFVRFYDPIMEVLFLEQVDRNELFNECKLFFSN